MTVRVGHPVEWTELAIGDDVRHYNPHDDVCTEGTIVALVVTPGDPDPDAYLAEDPRRSDRLTLQTANGAVRTFHRDYGRISLLAAGCDHSAPIAPPKTITGTPTTSTNDEPEPPREEPTVTAKKTAKRLTRDQRIPIVQAIHEHRYQNDASVEEAIAAISKSGLPRASDYTAKMYYRDMPKLGLPWKAWVTTRREQDQAAADPAAPLQPHRRGPAAAVYADGLSRAQSIAKATRYAASMLLAQHPDGIVTYDQVREYIDTEDWDRFADEPSAGAVLARIDELVVEQEAQRDRVEDRRQRDIEQAVEQGTSPEHLALIARQRRAAKSPSDPFDPFDPRTCRECGCTDVSACVDERTGEACHWVADDLCSQCADAIAQGILDEERATEILATRVGEVQQTITSLASRIAALLGYQLEDLINTLDAADDFVTAAGDCLALAAHRRDASEHDAGATDHEEDAA